MTEYRIIEGDASDVLRTLPAASVQTVITSPPYWGLRDYGAPGQLGLEPTPEEYVQRLVAIFAEVRRVLRDDGTVWLNLGDSYAGGPAASGGVQRLGPNHDLDNQRNGVDLKKLGLGLKPKDLVGIPWRVAFALQADGWYLRSDIIWAKPNPMPESVTDRPTKAHEYVFLLTKSARYFFDADAVREPMMQGEWFHGAYSPPTLDGSERTTSRNGRDAPGWIGREPTRNLKENAARHDGGGRATTGNPAGRNIRSVWNIATHPYPGAHFATFPPKLVEPCVRAGSAIGTTVLDPFAGAGTCGMVALREGRDFIGIELNPTYAQMARDRIWDDGPLFNVAGGEPT